MFSFLKKEGVMGCQRKGKGREGYVEKKKGRFFSLDSFSSHLGSKFMF